MITNYNELIEYLELGLGDFRHEDVYSLAFEADIQVVWDI